MKTLILVLMMFGTASTVEAQGLKIVTWDGFLKGLELVEVKDGTWDFAHEGRPLYELTAVEVPAGLMAAKYVDYVPTNTSRAEREYVVLTDTNLTLDLRDLKGIKSLPVEVKLFFSCVRMGDGACRQHLAKLLGSGVTMQSLGLGAVSSDYRQSGILPDSRLTLGFFLNTAGQFAP